VPVDESNPLKPKREREKRKWVGSVRRENLKWGEKELSLWL
jgi:hypothetical protein